MLYNVVIKNVNALTEWAELEICGDEMTWVHEGFAKTGTGITSQILGKPGIMNVGPQTVIAVFHVHTYTGTNSMSRIQVGT
jgi:hypothetical protein